MHNVKNSNRRKPLIFNAFERHCTSTCMPPISPVRPTNQYGKALKNNNLRQTKSDGVVDLSVFGRGFAAQVSSPSPPITTLTNGINCNDLRQSGNCGGAKRGAVEGGGR